MKSVTNIDEAKKLPERDGWHYETKILPDGTKEIIPSFPEIVAVDFEEGTILFFEDDDGILKEICYDAEGAYKKAFSI